MRRCTTGWRRQGLRTALVPLTGGLHDGHLSMVRIAKARADRVVVALLNNTGRLCHDGEYTVSARQLSADIEKLEDAAVDLLFLPAEEEFHPQGSATRVAVDVLTDLMCGSNRPGYFDDVTLAVTKVLNIVPSDYALFGEKDWQCTQIMRRLVRDLHIDTEILTCPTVREADGLAMSSRNARMDREARQVARSLYAALKLVADEIANGVPTELSCARAEDGLIASGFDAVDYLECRDGESLRMAMAPFGRARVFGAARIGDVRLIDNVEVPV
ncbi:4-phosphopantoate--beta-alanine ligase [Algicella marina]|uniref:4-phosphopantoate--beta-alanine ligase n=1 Tax=Algicella marina TaxID=2683284 RepID=UPI00137A1C3C|nr:pantoate--beta-alanine ligase [Algicella marina]